MKYWLYQDGKVVGPYYPDELLRLPSYTEDSLVAVEARLGGIAGSWRTAGAVAELAASIRRKPVSPVKELARPNGGRHDSQPADQALRDIIRFGNLQDKVAQLEATVSSMKEEAGRKDAELASLRKGLEAKSPAPEFQANWVLLQARLAEAASLRERFDQAAASQRHFESMAESQRRTINELTGELERLRDRVRLLEGGPSRPPLAPVIPPARRLEAAAARPVAAAAPLEAAVARPEAVAARPVPSPPQVPPLPSEPGPSRAKLVVAGVVLAALACAGAYFFGRRSHGNNKEPLPVSVGPVEPAVPMARPAGGAPSSPRLAKKRPAPGRPTTAAQAPVEKKRVFQELTPEQLEGLLSPAAPMRGAPKSTKELTLEELEQLLSPKGPK